MAKIYGSNQKGITSKLPDCEKAAAPKNFGAAACQHLSPSIEYASVFKRGLENQSRGFPRNGH
jgi:hypothetical protein